MTKQKSNRIFLGIVTGAMALAGTGLTIANNWSSEIQIASIAVTLAACFTAAEVTFLWGHKRFEDATKLWRKIVLSISLGALVLSMGFAVYEELTLALAKLENKSLAANSALIVESATSPRSQTRLGIKAIDNLSKDKIKINAIPFVICYLITGLVSIAILASTERKRIRSTTYGNQIPVNPKLQAHINQIGFEHPKEVKAVKAYRDSGDRGYSIHSGGKYHSFISDKDLSKYS